ncbi:hypothetical protein SARC_14778, partial [Sphaeroforma arctica JP610]
LITSVDGSFVHVFDRITEIAAQNDKRKKALESLRIEQKVPLRMRAKQATQFTEDLQPGYTSVRLPQNAPNNHHHEQLRRNTGTSSHSDHSTATADDKHRSKCI